MEARREPVCHREPTPVTGAVAWAGAPQRESGVVKEGVTLTEEAEMQDSKQRGKICEKGQEYRMHTRHRRVETSTLESLMRDLWILRVSFLFFKKIFF